MLLDCVYRSPLWLKPCCLVARDEAFVMSKLLRVDQVNRQTVFPGNVVPRLGLEGDPDRQTSWVYVLECAPQRQESEPTYYTGHAEDFRNLMERFNQHFAGTGAAFTQKHKPRGIAFLMPVAHAAAEGYVYYALLSKLPDKSVHRLGGWTQNSVNPSPLARMLARQARRNMCGKCFNCGSADHFVDECNKAPEGAPYPCACGLIIHVTSAGQTPRETRPPPADPQPPPPQPEEPPPKRIKVAPNTCLRVRVCGESYTTLAWFLNNDHPGKRARRLVQEKCLARAVEIKDGNGQTLVSKNFARTPPCRGGELLPDRVYLPGQWTDTACPVALYSRTRASRADPDTFVQLRKVPKATGYCRGMLFRLEDLQATLSE